MRAQAPLGHPEGKKAARIVQRTPKWDGRGNESTKEKNREIRRQDQRRKETNLKNGKEERRKKERPPRDETGTEAKAFADRKDQGLSLERKRKERLGRSLHTSSNGRILTLEKRTSKGRLHGGVGNEGPSPG